MQPAQGAQNTSGMTGGQSLTSPAMMTGGHVPAPASIPVSTNVNTSNSFQNMAPASAPFSVPVPVPVSIPASAPASVPVSIPVNVVPVNISVTTEHQSSPPEYNIDRVKSVLYRCMKGERTQNALKNEPGVTKNQFTSFKFYIANKYNEEKEGKNAKLTFSNKSFIDCYESEGSHLLKRIIDETNEMPNRVRPVSSAGVGVKTNGSASRKPTKTESRAPRRSGGPRPNAGGARPNTGGPRRNSGGAREGSGSKLKNVLKLDHATYESLMASTKDVLICFHDTPNGSPEVPSYAAYSKLVQAFRSEDIVVTSIHAPTFPEIAQIYELQQLPTIIAKFADSRRGLIRMEGAASATAEDMVAFVNNCLGSSRLLDGSLAPNAGRIQELDEIICSTSRHKIEENLVISLKKCFEDINSNNFTPQKNDSITSYYQIACAALRKGLEYIKEEHDREVEMLKKKHIKTPKKHTKHTIRLNILKSFKEHFGL